MAVTGFKDIFTWTDRKQVQSYLPDNHLSNMHLASFRNAHYSPHSHRGLTTHLILRGELTIAYPDDPRPTKETFGVGARLDVDAGRRHEVSDECRSLAINHFSFLTCIFF